MSESARNAEGHGIESLDEPSQPETTVSTDESVEDATESISKDELFHLLQNSRRRAVVRYLEGRSGTVRMRDVAEQVAAWEHDTTVQELTSTERQRVYIALYQSHLDTLADAGVIEYNKPRGVIEPTPLLEEVAAYGDTDSVPDGDADEEQDWARRYLSVSIIGSILLVGTVADFTVFQFVSTFAASILILFLFSLLTVSRLFAESPSPS